MAQDTGKFRQNIKDQYYTKSCVAKKCVDAILAMYPLSKDMLWIEPSAGNGAFLRALPNTVTDRVGIDIDPKSVDIIKADFLDWVPHVQNKKRVVFGNPPFGRQGSLAKAFIGRACSFADIVAFVLPRSFVKPSMLRAFPLKFHCVLTEVIEKDAFEVNGAPYDVPCVFQIWSKMSQDRVPVTPVSPVGFQYVKADSTFHIAFRRVGGLAGKSYLVSDGPFSAQTHYFWLVDSQYIVHLGAIINRINDVVFPSNTVGPRSLSKSEANEVMNTILLGLA